MVNHPNRNRNRNLSTTEMLRVDFDYQDGWYFDHPGQPNYTGLIEWPAGQTLRQAIAPRCHELGVDPATATARMVSRTWHQRAGDRNLAYVSLWVGTGEDRGVIIKMVFDYETLLPHFLKSDNILEMVSASLKTEVDMEHTRAP